jgi:hypothetical protein
VDDPTSSTNVPSGIVVALFAWLASAAVARYAFGRPRGRGD